MTSRYPQARRDYSDAHYLPGAPTFRMYGRDARSYPPYAGPNGYGFHGPQHVHAHPSSASQLQQQLPPPPPPPPLPHHLRLEEQSRQTNMARISSPPDYRMSLQLSKLKTALCHHYETRGSCVRGESCSFAHGEAELRPPRIHSMATHKSVDARGAGMMNGTPYVAIARPNPSKRKVMLCWHYMGRGTCPRGDYCDFAHGEADLAPATYRPATASAEAATSAPCDPNVRKTVLCRHFEASGVCNRGSTCNFAHGKAELVPKTYVDLPDGAAEIAPPTVHKHWLRKTMLCKHFTSRGSCVHGSACNFAHGEEELVPPPSLDSNGTAAEPRPVPPLGAPFPLETSSPLSPSSIPKKMIPCRIQMSKGVCYRGSACKFAHQ